MAFRSHFDPLSLQLNRLIDEKMLGRIAWSSANTIGYRTDDYYRSGPWYRGARGRGVLINHAIHTSDLML